ncbi:hypothetical protein [Haliangium sp.]|uniref:hypothetical protein n=1 Tax=Haliangium sp. TaxID=2663208 RepID=UPI003D134B84
MPIPRRGQGGARRARWGAALVIASVALTAGFALGQEADQGDELDQASEPDRREARGGRAADDGYGGVTPGEAAESKRKRKRPNRVTWVGFQPRAGGGSRLFVQLTSEVGFEQELRNGTLVVKLDNARYDNRNASRRLDMRFFDSALRQVTGKRVSRRRARRQRPARSAGIELAIEFKNPDDAAEARAELRAEQDGYYYLYLDFEPPGPRPPRGG